MDQYTHLWKYVVVRLALSRQADDERGEVSATTVIWAAALVLAALGVSALLVDKIRSKANSIDFG